MNETQPEKKPIRTMKTFRLTPETVLALQKRAKELKTSEANAISVSLGAMPESAFISSDKRGKLIVR